MSAWLTPEEVARLTDTRPRSYAAQRRRLAEMGVPFTTSYSGKPLVAASALLGGKARHMSPAGPDWSRLPGRAA